MQGVVREGFREEVTSELNPEGRPGIRQVKGREGKSEQGEHRSQGPEMAQTPACLTTWDESHWPRHTQAQVCVRPTGTCGIPTKAGRVMAWFGLLQIQTQKRIQVQVASWGGDSGN